MTTSVPAFPILGYTRRPARPTIIPLGHAYAGRSARARGKYRMVAFCGVTLEDLPDTVYPAVNGEGPRWYKTGHFCPIFNLEHPRACPKCVAKIRELRASGGA